MIKHILEFAVPFILWMGMAWFLSDGGKKREDFWYVVLLPIVMVLFCGFILLISMFFAWLY